nr:reverse transcriptase domain-containing protein [Tanacetum cinerariifolium]
MMADQRTMAQLLQEPTEGYEDAIVIPAITADNFELKHGLLTLFQNKQFYGHDKEDPHAHIRYFNKITSTLKFPNVPNTSIKLMLFPFSLEDQDSLNFDVGGNFLDKMPCDCLSIIESKSKVRYSRDKPIVAKVSTNASTSGVLPDVAELKDIVKALLLDKKGPVYQPPIFEQPAYQAPAYQASAPQIQGVSKEDFSAYVKANDAVMKNMQTQGQNMQNQLTNLTDLITNGVSYDGHQISPPVVENEPEATKDTVNPTNNGNTKDVQPQAKRLSLPDLTPTCMTQELAGRSISHLVGVAEDVYVKVGSFHFSADFVVVDFDADPRVPLILGRSFLKTERALIDVFEGELTLRVGKEPITFNMDQTSRYSANYSDMMAKRIDVIDMACEEYSQEVLSFSDTISSGSPTPYDGSIVFATSPTLTLFGNNDFLLEEVDAFLAIEDEPTSFEFHQSYLDPEGDILFLEAFLNDDPSSPPPNKRNYLPEVRKELKICEAKTDKSSVDEPPAVELKALPPHFEYVFLEVDEPPAVELKALPPHFEYVFLEGDNKLPVIIAKDLSVEEKTDLITVLKSHKRAIAWKLSDIKGINPEFCTHKILMEEDFTPVVQHQRRVNPKIHDVIKQEVIKLLDAGLSYPISDSPWVGPVHCVPKKEGFTVVENEDNELIPTRLVTGWRDQEKTTFTCPYGTFAYRRMPFGLCNAPGTFQRNLFQSCLSHLEKMLKRCEDTNLYLNWEKSHFMVKEGIVDRWVPALSAMAGKKERKALKDDQYNRCSKKPSRVVSPTRLE